MQTFVMTAVVCLLLVVTGFAQSPFSQTATVSVQVSGLTGQNPVAGTDAVGRLNVTPNLEVGTDNFMAPSYHSDFGDFLYSPAAISKFIQAHTSLNGNNIRVAFGGGAGAVFFNGASPKVSALAKALLQYSPAGNGKVAIEFGVDWLSADPHNVAVHSGPVLTF